jgi:NADH dehydrogenase/NADH:ubiquinone oxidoreductase subunit G
MKINVTGRGVIPGIGVLAPQTNREVDIETLRKIIACKRFVVYDTETGTKITTGNFKNFFYKYQSVESVVEPGVVENDTPVVDSFVETTSNEIVESIVNDNVSDEVVVDKSVFEETTDNATDVIVAESEEITTVSADDETVEVPEDVDAVEVAVDTSIDSDEVTDDITPVVEEDVEETPKSTTSNKKRNKKKH